MEEININLYFDIFFLLYLYNLYLAYIRGHTYVLWVQILSFTVFLKIILFYLNLFLLCYAQCN